MSLDPVFAQMVEDAKRDHLELCEAELHRRAVEGWDEPVWWQGAQVGTRRRYSDALLTLKLKRLDPRYRESAPPVVLEGLTDAQLMRLAGRLRPAALVQDNASPDAETLATPGLEDFSGQDSACPGSNGWGEDE